MVRCTRCIENKGGYVAKLRESYCADSVMGYRLKTISFKYSCAHPHRVLYVKLVCMRSWNNDVGRYVTVTELLNSIFNILPIFLLRWEIKTYWLNNSVESTFCLRASPFPEFPRSFNRTAAESLMLLPLWQRKTKLVILWVNNVVNISSFIFVLVYDGLCCDQIKKNKTCLTYGVYGGEEMC